MYSADEIPGTEAVAEHRHLALLLSNRLKPEYSEICGSVRAQTSLLIVRPNTPIFRGTRDKEEYI